MFIGCFDGSAVGQNVQRNGHTKRGKGVIAEDMEKMRELNRGAQVEEKADNAMQLMDERRRAKQFLGKVSVRWKEVRIQGYS